MNEGDIPDWDISRLVESTKTDDIKQEISELVDRAEAFESKHTGRVQTLDAINLKNALQEREEIWNDTLNVLNYCTLTFYINADDREAQALRELALDGYANFRKALAFSDVEIANLVERNPDILEDREIGAYKYHLTKLRRKASHILSQEAEQLISNQKRFGPEAWSKLQGEIRGTAKAEIEIEGEGKELALMQLFLLSNSSVNREVRKDALEKFYCVLENNKRTLAYAYRSICGSYVNEMKSRGWPSPLSPVLHEEGIKKGTIDIMYQTLSGNDSAMRRYFEIKAQLLGIDKLADWDLWAPISKLDKSISWEEARRTIVDSYSRFDSKIGSWMENLFDDKRIHATAKPGKISFGKCAFCYRPNLSWIIFNFTGSLVDLITLAHEAGHGYHSYLTAKRNSFLNWFSTPMSLSETASLLGELILLNYLLSTSDKESKIEAICKLLESFRINTYDMLWRFGFETRSYDAISSGKYLDANTVARYWVESRPETIANPIEWHPKSKWMWAFIVHNFMPEWRYYNFGYSFGQLLVYALYDTYRSEGDSFKSEIIKILEAGGSAAPRDILEKAGFDITRKSFWKTGMHFAENLVKELEELVDEY